MDKSDKSDKSATNQPTISGVATERLSVRSLLAQGGGNVHEPYGEIVSPIHMSTTYERAPDNTYPTSAKYSRDTNPGYHACEQMLCALEGGADALLFSSGMAAAAAVFQSLQPGMRVVAPRVMYWGMRQWLITFADTWGLRLDLFEPAGATADETGAGNLAALLEEPADLVWIETPANPTWDITDIRATARLARAAGARLAVDSTVATPVFTQPLAMGADIVMHSATKYLNGHGDVLAGALVCAQTDDLWERIRSQRATGGAVPGPFEAWLLARGMRTLFARVELAAKSALQIAQQLNNHPSLSAVLYPGLSWHPGHHIASAQMHGGYGGMLSLRVKGGANAAINAASRVRLIKRATSLGSTESLIEHRASIEGVGTICPDDLLRVSVGIEETDDLIADLTQALQT